MCMVGNVLSAVTNHAHRTAHAWLTEAIIREHAKSLHDHGRNGQRPVSTALQKQGGEGGGAHHTAAQ
jgi:hypothetical protein